MMGPNDGYLTLLDERHIEFPPTNCALRDPNGLLAIGGKLSPPWLLTAYRRGIFPWFSDDQPILWWSPSPRCVVFPERCRIGRSLRKVLRRGTFQVTFDRAFEQVVEACRAPRPDAEGTWITDEMRDAYVEMHRLGHAHSVEVWRENRLAGGLYGIALGRVFFGESMFHRETDASKVAFVHLVRQLELWGCPLIDCQVSNPHLTSLGAVEVPREDFERLLEAAVRQPPFPQPWKLSWSYE
ncbi:leucyl/phenylalanyl-tRNA--protein transferase [Microbulbifer donghaiensis]|uniref:Leucyl/phenylalanyl-tRNA--protein transferase n=1 Tax=Microbulbifer donghaiensis TaxID=494016 RepID=A0A1M4V184_9GAMM|nr:leucyl/phenylalanyl-tRNA--protein transferase [Microbulbifer donghaiensis]SHE62633.1 leucyl/phenylalanyl-tRNA--protein transferase [Microbulbifer donghaiensis]